MKSLLTLSLLLFVSASLISQNITARNDYLIKTDTIQLPLQNRFMIIQQYGNDIKSINRLEVFNINDSLPFQTITNDFEYSAINDLVYLSIEDYNYDKIKDIAITYQDMSSHYVTLLYFYNNGLFKNDLGELVNPSFKSEDSTITVNHDCCMGREGGIIEYKCKNNRYIKIMESEWSEEKGYEKNIVGDSLVVTSYNTSTIVQGSYINSIIIDTIWNYQYGKLRVDYIAKKKRVDKSSSNNEEIVTDVMGSFITIYEEVYRYEIDKKNDIICTLRQFNKKGKKMVLVNSRKWKVKD